MNSNLNQLVMKKMNFLKVLMTMVMAFAITGAYAQYTGSDITGDGADFATNWETSATTHMIEGTTVPLFAMPDPYFHPDYDNVAEDYTLNDDGFTWTWTEGTGTLTINQSAAEDNYVTVSAAAGDAGTYTVNVLESTPAGWGGCNDGTGQDIDVVVHATPTATLGGDATYEGCEGSTGAPAAIEANISDGWQNYRLVWTLEIKTLNADLTDKDFYDTDKTTAGVPLAEEYTPGAPQAVAAAGPHNITSVAGGFTVIDNSTTVYTYSLTSINDQALRYGDFLGLSGSDADASSFTYNAIGETVSVTVYPTPTTGPIYHINSTWAN